MQDSSQIRVLSSTHTSLIMIWLSEDATLKVSCVWAGGTYRTQRSAILYISALLAWMKTPLMTPTTANPMTSLCKTQSNMNHSLVN